jgi:hypothetical protein
MGDITEPSVVLLFVAATSRYNKAFDWAQRRAVEAWGPLALESPRFSFTETNYYESTMGSNLSKCFWAFERLTDPADLPAIKVQANAWEAEYAGDGGHTESRPLNLDPGYLTPAKLVLATTKDHAHRLYLSRGIYAEVTLSYKDHRWQDQPWTYPDYRRDDYKQFFSACRELVRGRQRQDGRQ